jgi:hypothetical protein
MLRLIDRCISQEPDKNYLPHVTHSLAPSVEQNLQKQRLADACQVQLVDCSRVLGIWYLGNGWNGRGGPVPLSVLLKLRAGQQQQCCKKEHALSRIAHESTMLEIWGFPKSEKGVLA